MSDNDRHSRALDAELITDPDLKAQREVSNGLRQFDDVANRSSTGAILNGPSN
jgi:hypothetical protein